VALIHSMRLSSPKGAHADVASATWQEIEVKPFFGLSGIMALDMHSRELYSFRPWQFSRIARWSIVSTTLHLC
jgi:hypothetical protein